MERMKKAGVHARGLVEYYLNTAEIWAAFEDIVLDARTDLVALFDRFDAAAPVRTARGMQVAQTWGALLTLALARGVNVSLWIGSAGVAEIAALRARISEPPRDARRRGVLTLKAEPHPARIGRRRPFAHFPSGHRLNLAVVDGKTMLLSRAGLTVTAVQSPHRDLGIIAHGPVVSEATALLASFAAITAGSAEPGPARRLLRTFSRPGHGMRRMFGAQTVANEVESAHHMLIRRAARMIYIETQAFDSPALARHLALRAKSAPDLHMVLILPGQTAPVIAEEKQCLAILSEAFGPRIFIGRAAGGVANVSIFDDDTAIVGSADLSRHALGYDSHAAIYLRQVDRVDLLHERLSRHWLGDTQPEGVARWQAVAGDNLRAGRVGDGMLLPL